jgi:hypothetical protein
MHHEASTFVSQAYSLGLGTYPLGRRGRAEKSIRRIPWHFGLQLHLENLHVVVARVLSPLKVDVATGIEKGMMLDCSS